MLQNSKCCIIIYFALLKDTPCNSVFRIIENWAFALPILLAQLTSPLLDQVALLCSPSSGSDVYSVALARPLGFNSPKLNSTTHQLLYQHLDCTSLHTSHC